MRLREVRWAIPCNVALVDCDCGAVLAHSTSNSLCQCPRCGRAEYWHGFDPVAPRGTFFFSDDWALMEGAR